MSSRLSLLTAFLALALHAEGGIHADFSVSQGETSLGTFRVRLDFEKAPRTCANFIGLATGDRPWIDPSDGSVKIDTPYYDGIIFHRLDHDFVIQGGSPAGTGRDGPGFSILDEFHPDLRHSGRYILSMAKTPPPNTGGSQFFITLENASFLDDLHSVFGEVISGKEIIDNFTSSSLFPTDSNDRPLTPIVMNAVTLGGSSLNSFSIDDPQLLLPHVRNSSSSLEAVSYSKSTNSLFATLPRDSKTEYLLYQTEDLAGWNPLTRLTSIDEDSSYEFSVPNRTSDRYFMRCSAIDYQHVPSVEPDLGANGSRIIIADSLSGDSVELTFDGSGAGSWMDSIGNGGSLSEVSWTPSLPAAGAGFDPEGFASFFATGRLSAKFDAPAGQAGWTSLNSVLLSFHESEGGWMTGSASTSSGGVSLRNKFTYAP